jgi:hydrogenase nickel incorporation protein HypB
MSESPRLIAVRQNVLSKNDQLAQGLRARFDAAGLRVLNLLSSPGAGKTRLLEETLRRLGERYKVAALVGDLATDNDARRLARSGATVRQIETGGLCHLEADLIASHVEGWDLAEFDFLFIENVGNLVCPTSYDLGEHGRVVLMAVTEGEDKPLKYPGTFRWADLVLISKIDMAEAAEFDAAAARASIESVHPGAAMIATSARTGAGMGEWLAWLEMLRAQGEEL